jgi:hypothetical protein
MAHAWSCHAVYEGRYYKCAQAPFLEYRLSLLGIDVENKHVDGVPLHDNPNLRAQLEEYLADTRPLLACDYCLGTSGPQRPHRGLNKRGLQEWLAEDHSQGISQKDKDLARE